MLMLLMIAKIHWWMQLTCTNVLGNSNMKKMSSVDKKDATNIQLKNKLGQQKSQNVIVVWKI